MIVFHGTNRPGLVAGSIMRPRRAGMLRSAKPSIVATEAILEAARQRVAPKALRRGGCVFGAEAGDPLTLTLVGGFLDRVLECEPAGRPPERSNVAWWSAVNLFHGTAAPRHLDAWAQSYWLGQPFDRHAVAANVGDLKRYGGLADLWELRCQELHVVRVHHMCAGQVGPATVVAWGHAGDMLTITAPDTEAMRRLLRPSGQLRSKGGMVELVTRNDYTGARRLLDGLRAMVPAPGARPENMLEEGEEQPYPLPPL